MIMYSEIFGERIPDGKISIFQTEELSQQQIVVILKNIPLGARKYNTSEINTTYRPNYTE